MSGVCAAQVRGDSSEDGVIVFTLDFTSNPTICAPAAGPPPAQLEAEQEAARQLEQQKTALAAERAAMDAEAAEQRQQARPCRRLFYFVCSGVERW